MRKRLKATIAVAGLAAALGLSATPATASSAASPTADLGTLATCSSWTNSTESIAYGRCTSVSGGVQWRLGVICDSGYYYWSPWQNRDLTKSYDCPGVPGKVTSHWIDLQ
ncbi:hypothetical protein [Micromonospora sp. NPDC023956]|uniref:hypothetical protein n=1 Tax=Micromonospora sp. NPDC023956 TaxID=3155722 RepID=UPI00340ABA03